MSDKPNHMQATIKIKRIYDPYSEDDGYRILVDRLWPRGIKKETANIDKWLKEVAPSTELRKWYNHEHEKQEQFRIRYHDELKAGNACAELLSQIGGHKTVTLLYASRDEAYNHALVLRQFINNGLL